MAIEWKRVLAFAAAGLLMIAGRVCAAAPTTAPAAVTLEEDDTSYTIANGIVTARIAKRSGDLTSLQYNGTETLTDQSGHIGAYWSHDASGGAKLIDQVTIDPKTTDGDRVEVSVKGVSGGKKMGRPAGAGPDGDFPADIEIRWSLGRGDSGIYTYCTFTH